MWIFWTVLDQCQKYFLRAVNVTFWECTVMILDVWYYLCGQQLNPPSTHSLLCGVQTLLFRLASASWKRCSLPMLDLRVFWMLTSRMLALHWLNARATSIGPSNHSIHLGDLGLQIPHQLLHRHRGRARAACAPQQSSLALFSCIILPLAPRLPTVQELRPQLDHLLS